MAPKIPVTSAIRVLRKHSVPFEPHLYTYEPRGGTRRSAESLGVHESEVIKTLVFEDADGKPLIVLMHGDRQVSTKALARHLGTKSIRACEPSMAHKHSGYQVGGTSPFGTRKRMPIFVQRSILDLDRLWINGGKRGFLVRIGPADLQRVLDAEPVDVCA